MPTRFTEERFINHLDTVFGRSSAASRQNLGMTRLATLFARLGPDPRTNGLFLAAFLSDREEAVFAVLARRHGPTIWSACRRTLLDPVGSASRRLWCWRR